MHASDYLSMKAYLHVKMTDILCSPEYSPPCVPPRPTPWKVKDHTSGKIQFSFNMLLALTLIPPGEVKVDIADFDSN
jgi:hypothetical protein